MTAGAATSDRDDCPDCHVCRQAGVAGRQHTLAREVAIQGNGIHTGEPVKVILHPAPAGHGITFLRADIPGSPEIGLGDLDPDTAPGRTVLAKGKVAVNTVEHLLAAMSALGVDNARVEIHGPELPAADGSARPFAEAMSGSGLAGQEAVREACVIEEPLVVRQGSAHLVALPARPSRPDGGFTQVGYSLSYRDSSLARGYYEIAVTRDAFLAEVAPARTFCMARDVERLRALGLGKGANYENTLVIDGDRAIGTELRFPDEPVRHKVLDLIGDLGLVGAPVVGRIIGFRSGHGLNRELVRRILKSAARRPLEDLYPEPVMGIRQIEGILPHRYPFLLVDRVIELDPEKRIVAVKNVTWNEEFFLGHFPGSPVMPGVLQVEALAQAAGLLLSRYVRVGEKMAALVGLDRVKLRRPVTPGDRLLLNVEVRKLRRTLCVCESTVTVGSELVAEATLLFGLIRGPSEERA